MPDILHSEKPPPPKKKMLLLSLSHLAGKFPHHVSSWLFFSDCRKLLR